MLDPREYQQFLTQAQIQLTGASERGIKAELYDVLKEFFMDSNAWMEDIPFEAQANVDTYDLVPIDEGQIVRLVGTWDHNRSLVPAFMREFGTIKLLHAPSSTPAVAWFSRVTKTVTLPTVKDGLPVAPDWTFRVYSVHVLDGLLGKMMAQKDKSYHDTTMSGYHLRRFRTGIQMVRTAAARANLVGGQEWSYPRGFTRGSQRGGVSTGTGGM